MKILWIILIPIILYATYRFCLIVYKRQKLRQYIKHWDRQLILFGAQRAQTEREAFEELKNIPLKHLTTTIVAENIFSDYKLYIVQQARRKDSSLTMEECTNYLKTLTLKDFIDCTIPANEKLINEIQEYTYRVSRTKEVNINKICEHLMKHHQTSDDMEIASRVLDQLEPYITTDKELSEEEASFIVDRWAKEKALRKKFDDFCDIHPETKKALFKREDFWRDIKRVLYRIDSRGVQYNDIDFILSNDEWWESAYNRYSAARKAETLKENEEFQRLKRETAQMRRETRTRYTYLFE